MKKSVLLNKPLQQGDLDSLCGIHSIINVLAASGAVTTRRSQERLFKQLMRGLARHRAKPIKVMWQGMDVDLLRSLLREAARKLSTPHVTYQVKRLKAASYSDLAEALLLLSRKRQKGWLPILSIRGKYNHWTVIERITRDRIYLLDSNGTRYLRRSSCTLKKTRTKYRLFADEVVLVRRKVLSDPR